MAAVLFALSLTFWAISSSLFFLRPKIHTISRVYFLLKSYLIHELEKIAFQMYFFTQTELLWFEFSGCDNSHAASYPHGLEKIARQIDFSSKNQKKFWAADCKKEQSAPTHWSGLNKKQKIFYFSISKVFSASSTIFSNLVRARSIGSGVDRSTPPCCRVASG